MIALKAVDVNINRLGKKLMMVLIRIVKFDLLKSINGVSIIRF